MALEDIEITVQSILPSDEPQGYFHLKISPDSTVDTLLREICRKADVPLKPQYCLCNKNFEPLQKTSILCQIGVHDGALLHWTNKNVKMKIPCRFNTFWFLAAISFIIGSTGLVAICVLKSKEASSVIDYAIVFDAGSTHTAMFIYKWEGSKLNGTAVAVQYGQKCTAKGSGIASFVDNPQDAGKSIIDCLTYAKEAIPVDHHSKSQIYLGATAGMRLLNISKPVACREILDSICQILKSSPFKMTSCNTSVRIISGSEEGIFSWTTSNYVANAFNVQRPDATDYLAPTIVPSIGALDLGGASTQITFIPLNYSAPVKDFLQSVLLFGQNYNVYTHSYLCYGVNEITSRILVNLLKFSNFNNTIQHPCLPKGYNITMTNSELFASPCVSDTLQTYSFNSQRLQGLASQNYTFTGSSSGTACEKLLRDSLFNTSVCTYSRCSFNGVYQPDISGPFYAFSSFFYITNFLNLSSSNSSSFHHADLIRAKNKICNATWDELLEIPTTKQEQGNLMWYCLQSNYINLLLYEGYNFSEAEWTGINFVEMVSATEIGWSLGFVLNESVKYPSDYPEVLIYTVTFVFLIILFSLFIITSIGLAFQGRNILNLKETQYRKMSSYGAI